MLKIDKLTAHYDAAQALFGVSLEIAAGETVALVGANGAGKSTLLKCLMGLVKPTGGSILLDGKPVAGKSPVQMVRLGLALSPEGREVFGSLSVEENLQLGAVSLRLAKGEEAIRREEVFARFPKLKERRTQLAGTLSGGEQQMLAIGRALARDIKVLLLDEPYEGLAPVIVDEIEKTLNIIKQQGITTILVEQNAVRALKLADRAVILETGGVVFDGTAREVLENEQLRHDYLAI